MSFKDPEWLEEKSKYLDRRIVAKRELAECIQNFQFTALPKYSPHDEKHLPFMEYFYPWEKLYLRTKNFEKFSCRTKKSNKCFRNNRDLIDYTREMSDPSSHNEDIPPASEELFFDTSLENEHEDIMQKSGYAPRLTLLQRSLLRDLDALQLGDRDTGAELQRRTIAKRLELIRGHCKELKRKRYAKAYRRFTRVHSKRMCVADEGLELMIEELLDKDLNREFYYAADEPKELQSLLESRRNSIQQKYQQYVQDPKFRRAFQAGICYNVNHDVPASVDNDQMWSKDLSLVRCQAVRMRGGQETQKRSARWPTGLTINRGEYEQVSANSSRNDMMMQEGFKFDHLITQQQDDDLPTSEAEQMDDLGAEMSEHMRCRRQRMLKSLHRLMRVEALGAMPPNEMACHLCYLELLDKGLFDPNATADPRSADRVLAISQKFRKFGSDPGFRERYLNRVRSIKPEVFELVGGRQESSKRSQSELTAGSEYSDAIHDRSFLDDDDQAEESGDSYMSNTIDMRGQITANSDQGNFTHARLKGGTNNQTPSYVDNQMRQAIDLPQSPRKQLKARFMSALDALQPTEYQSSTAMSMVTVSSDGNYQSKKSYEQKVSYTNHAPSEADNLMDPMMLETPPPTPLEIWEASDDESFKYSQGGDMVEAEEMPDFAETPSLEESEEETDWTQEEYEDVYAENSDEIDRTSPGIFTGVQSSTGEETPEESADTERSGDYFFNEGTPSQDVQLERRYYIIKDAASLGPIVDLPPISPQAISTEIPAYGYSQSRMVDELPSPKSSRPVSWVGLDDYQLPSPVSWVGLDDYQSGDWNPYARERLPKQMLLRGENDLNWADDDGDDDVERGEPHHALTAQADDNYLLSVHKQARELAEKFFIGLKPFPEVAEDPETLTMHVTKDQRAPDQTDANDWNDADRVAYTEITTAESSFDDEVPSSEDEAFANGPILARPVEIEYAAMSRMKMQLFIALAELEMDNSARNASALELHQKRLFRVRRFHARLVKRRRKAAVVRLLKLGINNVDIKNSDNMILYLHNQERRNKGLSQRKHYFDEGEPAHMTQVIKNREEAIANKFNALKRGKYELAMYVRGVLMGLEEKIELITY